MGLGKDIFLDSRVSGEIYRIVEKTYERLSNLENEIIEDFFPLDTLEGEEDEEDEFFYHFYGKFIELVVTNHRNIYFRRKLKELVK